MFSIMRYTYIIHVYVATAATTHILTQFILSARAALHNEKFAYYFRQSESDTCVCWSIEDVLNWFQNVKILHFISCAKNHTNLCIQGAVVFAHLFAFLPFSYRWIHWKCPIACRLCCMGHAPAIAIKCTHFNFGFKEFYRIHCLIHNWVQEIGRLCIFLSYRNVVRMQINPVVFVFQQN